MSEISFFSFLFAPQYTHKAFECSFVLCYNQIERKNGILRVRIDISGSLSGFECGDEEYGTKSIIDGLDESDSVVVDLCD